MKGTELAYFIIAKFDVNKEEISNKKLQKILYYIEAWSLVHLQSIIDDEFEAWVHGSVIPDVYHTFKKYGYSPIKINYGQNSPEQFIDNFISNAKIMSESFVLIDSVLDKYGKLSSLQLELLSHMEQPWIQARGNNGPLDHCSNVIDKKVMLSYYSSLIT